MPGFDGTGPMGRGPMTGRGAGYCALKIPRTPDEPQTGFAGLPGKPVILLPCPPSMNLASLQVRAQRIQLALHDMDHRIGVLETVRQGIGDPRRNADVGKRKKDKKESKRKLRN